MARFVVKKYTVKPNGAVIKIRMPAEAVILAFRSRYGEPVLYTKEPLQAKDVVRKFNLVTTAVPEKEDPNLVYVGTVEWASEGWHLFEIVVPAPA